MSELTATRVREHAERLHLPHLGESLDALVARAEAKTMGYLEFIDLVLEEELGVREGRRFANALKLSGLPPPQEPGQLRLRLPTRPGCPQGPRPGRAGVRPGQGQRLFPGPTGGRQDHAGGRPGHRRLPGRLLDLPAPPWTTSSAT